MMVHTTFLQKASDILASGTDDMVHYLFYLDFAEFKMVNHHYGYERGDELLAETVEYVWSVPGVKYCERVFSDHIIFLVARGKDQSEEALVKEFDEYGAALIQRFAARYPACKHRICCGIAKIGSEDLMESIDLANLARLEVKKAFGNTYHLLLDSEREEKLQQMNLEQEVMLALRKKRFIFYLQPKVDMLTGQIIGAEALARRVDKDGTIIYPDYFIPILEENGAIIDLDFLIFEQVCQHLSERLQKGIPVVATSVNLSRLHLWNPNDVDRLHAIAQKYQVPAALLEFELTEQLLLNDFEKARIFGERLNALGYLTSVDDFGSGYAGINIWQELTFNTLKLDRRFLTDEPVIKSRNTVIIHGIVEIAQKFGIDVLCEGVERADQCQRLLSLGCRYAQGFYFSAAMPPEEFYRNYQERRGYYPVPFRMADETT